MKACNNVDNIFLVGLQDLLKNNLNISNVLKSFNEPCSFWKSSQLFSTTVHLKTHQEQSFIFLRSKTLFYLISTRCFQAKKYIKHQIFL